MPKGLWVRVPPWAQIIILEVQISRTIFNHNMTKSPTKNILRIIPLGGLGEVGRNMMLFEFKRKILVIDMGFRFPEEDMPGIDYIIPNISCLQGRDPALLSVADLISKSCPAYQVNGL